MKALGLAAIALAAAPVAAAAPDQARAEHITIVMTDHGFEPHLVNLRHGEPYVVRFVNRSDRGHDFQAPEFFDAVRLDPRSRSMLRKAAVDLDPGQAATLRLVAPRGPGRFPFKSSHLTDALSGMSGYIVIR